MTAEESLAARAAAMLATWFGAGRLPLMPGTWGSLAALPFAWALLWAWGAYALAAAIVVLFLLGWWAASQVAGGAQADPPAVVVDEVVGQWIALLAAPPSLGAFVLAFALFRAFDILKPWPIRWADRNVPGGLGVMLDDVLAGAGALAAFAVIQWLMP